MVIVYQEVNGGIDKVFPLMDVCKQNPVPLIFLYC